MSHFSNAVGPSGPILICFIGISVPKFHALTDAGITAPVPQLANILIDTGASHTIIDTRFVGLLGLAATGSMPMHTPSTGSVPHNAQTYDIALSFAGHASALHTLAAHSVSACDFSGQGIDGLLVRDVLATARLIYSGPDKFYYLSF